MDTQEFDLIEIHVYLDPPQSMSDVEKEAKNVIERLTRAGYDARSIDIRGPETAVEE